MFYFHTDKGLVREKNEDNVDAFVHNDVTFMMVLDGMGGHKKGETASSMAMKIVREKITNYKHFRSVFHLRHQMIKAIKKANKEVNILGNSLIEYAEMGTTLILVAIMSDSLIMCNIGDSRCYVIDENKLQQISVDQTYVEFLYNTGKITEEEKKIHPKRHVLMNALGTYPSISVATTTYKRKFDKIMLCSDGLYNMVENEYIEKILLKTDLTTEEKVKELVKLSNLNGGKDNIAIALWEDK